MSDLPFQAILELSGDTIPNGRVGLVVGFALGILAMERDADYTRGILAAMIERVPMTQDVTNDFNQMLDILFAEKSDLNEHDVMVEVQKILGSNRGSS